MVNEYKAPDGLAVNIPRCVDGSGAGMEFGRQVVRHENVNIPRSILFTA